MVAATGPAPRPRWRRALTAGLAAGVLVLASLGGTAWAEPAVDVGAGVRCDSGVVARLDEVVTATLERTGVPGVIVGVSGPDCRYEAAFGVADKATGEPMRTDFHSRIGSETKTFTVTALLQLVDDGAVGLDDPIGEYVAGVPEGDRITLRQLARMQSGLFNYSADEDFLQALVSDPYRSFTPQELLGYSFAHPLDFPPGEGWEYSNTNTILLGLVVEEVSGQPLHEYLDEHVFEPLALDDTAFPTDNSFPEPHAEGYTVYDGTEIVATDFNPSWGWAAGAMTSTLDDLHTWAHALATGTLLEPGTQAQRLETAAPPGGAPGVGYGLGLFVVSGWIGHNGSLPGYQSLTVYLPEQETSLVVLLNSDAPPLSGDVAQSSSAFGTAITEVVSPGHVFWL
ncbi:serine hydrolase domain-containing protein [Geodermatophilus poikilotrophus]|uniref:D-alanyl-D-alanine carboxypeptidase n=1 Tax=Geodermatophilus poikilotrophus TaxID=1333667 RepID=A0A1I0DVF5_9ACTN|nr:serine hydrolase domain-containing protein [Geodermatophilus poikilotrophus]SET36607.1 D-alanyl-D-alanine carboxypeptidase [Geodermatophilus poikilotrophus]